MAHTRLVRAVKRRRQPLRVLVCGEREWSESEPIQSLFLRLEESFGFFVCIHGAARGADTLAGYLAAELGHLVIAYPANWEKHGRAAGPIRNRQMLLQGYPDLGAAFFLDRSKSRGTNNMVSQMDQAKVPLLIYEREKGWTRNDLGLLSDGGGTV